MWPRCGALRADADRVHAALVALGAAGLQEFDRALFRPIRLAA